MASGLAGRLRTRLRIERFDPQATDGAGGFTGNWTQAGAIWAEMAEAGEMAATEGGQRARRTRFKVTSRAADFDLAYRLRLGERAFTVLSVTRDPMTPDRMRLLVEEIAR